jgi:hypothetical protein
VAISAKGKHPIIHDEKSINDKIIISYKKGTNDKKIVNSETMAPSRTSYLHRLAAIFRWLSLSRITFTSMTR